MQVLAVPVTRNLLIHYFTLYGKVSQLVYCSPLEDHKGLGDTEPLSRLAAKWLSGAWDSCNLRASHQLRAAFLGLQSWCGQENNGP